MMNKQRFEKISVECLGRMGSDLTVVNAARVSFAARSDWDVGDDDFKQLSKKDRSLIEFLAKHQHWTPFAHCMLQFHIVSPIFVARQLGKHQVGLAWNKVSRRYVDDTKHPVTFFQPSKWRERDPDIKQGSSDSEIVQTKMATKQIAAAAEQHFPVSWKALMLSSDGK